jgi:hypothetical protein
LTLDQSSERKRIVHCSQPQRSHRQLFVVLVGHESEEKGHAIGEQIRQTLDPGRPSAGFDHIEVINLMSPDFTGNQVQRFFSEKMQKTMHRRASSGAVEDVLLVYYVGPETAGEGGRLLLTGGRENGRRYDSALRQEDLAEQLDKLLGARLVFLDVARESASGEATSPLSVWPTQSRLAVFRYAWLGRNDVPPQGRLHLALAQAVASAKGLFTLGDFQSAAEVFGNALSQKKLGNPHYQSLLPEEPWSLRSLLLKRP